MCWPSTFLSSLVFNVLASCSGAQLSDVYYVSVDFVIQLFCSQFVLDIKYK